MSTINPYSTMLPPAGFLVPGPSLIDSRTEQDWLSFLCDYASLINFYDGNNELSGNWTPFLLKDPVFLLAHISKTRFSEFHSRYFNTCSKLDKLLKTGTNTKETAVAFNQLFDQLTEIFIYIKRWIYFMQRTDVEYDLKRYIIHHTRTSFSKHFWAIISLRQSLHLSSVIKWIEPADDSEFYFFDAREEMIWMQNKDKSPFWEILNLVYPIKNNTATGFFNAIKNSGDGMVNFFCTIVQHADSEFGKLKQKKSSYPDTTLLRTFVNLLSIYQDQLNGISKKHLKFYYNDVLKQTKEPAVADTVFLCSQLANNTATFNLPAGTLFNAGVDAQKNPILFSTQETVNLNPGAITGGNTLFKSPASGTAAALGLQSIPAPGVLQKDKDGKVQSWVTFGGTVSPQTTLIKPGFAFSSPMLFLREGQREITLELNFASVINPQLLQSVNYYLSTQSAWLLVPGTVQPPTDNTAPQTRVTVQIKLDQTQPPIESFKKNPDGLNSSWPMLKIEFNSFFEQATPPVLTSLTVNVNVSGVQTFQLYNDFGLLSTKKSYPLFGPTPLVNSNFIIGSNEIFSKPLDSLVIELNWDNLPPDFQAYYQQYNNYINPPSTESQWAIVRWFKKLFHISQQPSDQPFNNNYFKVDFSLLQNGSWNEFDMNATCGIGTSATVQPKGNNITLFTEDSDSGALINSSIFGYPVVPGTSSSETEAGDPGIQNSALKFTDTSKWGFMKITLAGPGYGFGSTLYPNVISDIALQNALMVVNKEKKFLKPAAMPFVPELNSFSATYSASCQYTFNTTATGTYPIQCFLYAPFKNYTVYDSSAQIADYTYTVDDSGASNSSSGVAMWPPINHTGYLFLEISNLLPSNALNLYFELARNYTNSVASNKADYYYISNSGWKGLNLLSDGTNNFSCSGIIKVSVPDDISNAGVAMPGNNYWFCIAVKDDPASFSQTVLLETNGFTARRTGNFTSTGTAPELAAGTITKPQTAIPQIAATTQPFPSFGGKAAEDHTEMNLRVSNRLKTKDRAVSTEDYFRLINQEYDDIYYSKPVFDPQSKSTGVYVIRAFDNWTDPGAFLPMISTCKEEKISKFLNGRTSVFSNISVSNFDFQYVRVIATVLVADGLEPLTMQKNIAQALDVFLSPWITSDGQQVTIDEEITGAQVADFFKSMTGVMGVESVLFQTWMVDMPPGLMISKESVAPLAPKALMVSSMDHQIECNVVV